MSGSRAGKAERHHILSLLRRVASRAMIGTVLAVVPLVVSPLAGSASARAVAPISVAIGAESNCAFYPITASWSPVAGQYHLNMYLEDTSGGTRWVASTTVTRTSGSQTTGGSATAYPGATHSFIAYAQLYDRHNALIGYGTTSPAEYDGCVI